MLRFGAMSRNRRLPALLETLPFVVRIEDGSPPFDWTSVFGRPAPVELEIGAGKGLFLASAGAQNPDRSFLGVERAGKYFRRAAVRVHKSGLGNVRLLRADAFDFLERWVPPGSVDVVHVYFPDPWPKKRHAKRRLLQGELYAGVHRALREGGVFCLGSDVRSYFDAAVAEVLELGLFDRVEWPEDAPDRIPTSYAIKYAQEGRGLNYAKFRRRAPRLPVGIPGPIFSPRE